MPTSAHAKVPNSPQFGTKVYHSLRGDVGIAPYGVGPMFLLMTFPFGAGLCLA